MTGHTPTPWFVRDFRATEMKRLGWTGPAIDRILITNATGAEIEAASGANSVIARIQFDNRNDLLKDGNRADADFIVKSVNSHADLVKALEFALNELDYIIGKHGYVSTQAAAIRARQAIAKASQP